MQVAVFADDCFEVVSQRTCNVENGRFACRDGSRCISASKVCDQRKDCPDGSDELDRCEVPCANKVGLGQTRLVVCSQCCS